MSIHASLRRLIVLGAVLTPVLASAEGVATVPLYRLFEERSGVNFYTTDKPRRLAALAVGWKSVGIAGHCLPQKVPGTVPLMALVASRPAVQALGVTIPPRVIFVYSTDIDEVTSLQQQGWSAESTTTVPGAKPVCFVAPRRMVVGQSFPGTVPLHRLAHPAPGPAFEDHFYTTSEKEMSFAVRKGAYTYEWVEAHLWAEPATVSGFESSHATPKIHVPGGGTASQPSGCTRFLGRADDYLCRTPEAFASCETLRKAGKAKTCRQAR
jgi:hypothetical protein